MIPKHYGSKSALHEHYQRWVHAGIFEEILRIIASEYQTSVGFDFEWQSMDGSLIPAPARKKKTNKKDSGQIQRTEDAMEPKSTSMWTGKARH